VGVGARSWVKSAEGADAHVEGAAVDDVLVDKLERVLVAVFNVVFGYGCRRKWLDKC